MSKHAYTFVKSSWNDHKVTNNLLWFWSIQMFFVGLSYLFSSSQKSFAGANEINWLFIETHTRSTNFHIWNEERWWFYFSKLMYACSIVNAQNELKWSKWIFLSRCLWHFICARECERERERDRWEMERKNLNYEYEFPLRSHSCFDIKNSFRARAAYLSLIIAIIIYCVYRSFIIVMIRLI